MWAYIGNRGAIVGDVAMEGGGGDRTVGLSLSMEVDTSCRKKLGGITSRSPCKGKPSPKVPTPRA